MRQTAEPSGLEVAIIGMACRFPGAEDLHEYWRNLCAGVESIVTFSEKELDVAGSSRTTQRNDYVAASGVLDSAEFFDAPFFGISPREAQIIDPQQRLLLECAWEALEHAGYDPDSYAGLIGLFAGVGSNAHPFNLVADRDLFQSVGALAAAAGCDKDHATMRIAYKLNLRGPAVTVQTSCSTSLVAVNTACQALVSGSCDMALAGGASIRLPLRAGYVYEEGGILSPDGHCRAFDARANGTVPGSGAGFVVLKRLENALAERDHLFAVIRGFAINNDGAGKIGYTAPSVAGQASVIHTAHLMAGVKPEAISYVETHGTGTRLGDPIEIASLRQAFGGFRSPCAIGSVKTNIGHLDAAAGVAGLIKTVLALYHESIPPSLHFERPNPELGLEGSPLYVNTHLAPWNRGALPRLAGVSSFGIGGTNAHVVLEEAPAQLRAAGQRAWQLVLLSAKTEAALAGLTAKFVQHLRSMPTEEFADFSYTSQLGRRHFACRRAVTARDPRAAADALAKPPSLDAPGGAADTRSQRVMFMFPGQGTQYVNMTRELYDEEPVFARHVEECAGLLKPLLGLDIRCVLYPEPQNAAQAAQLLDRTDLTQPALFAVEYSLARLWMSWGITPWAMIGHSVGEFVAACLAEVFTLADALCAIALRGRNMQLMPAGAMLAVQLQEEEIQRRLSPRIAVAAVNGPHSCTVSGQIEDILELERALMADGVRVTRLRTSHAFHSSMMEPAVSQFEREIAALPLGPPRVPFISNVTGTWITDAQATDPTYWGRQLRNTVQFARGLEAARAEGPILLEVGPGTALTRLARRAHGTAPAFRAVPSLQADSEYGSAVADLMLAAGTLWTAGISMNWGTLHTNDDRRRVPIPTYAFQRQRYHVEPSSLAQRASTDSMVAPDRNELSRWLYVPLWRQATPLVSVWRSPPSVGQRALILMDDLGLGVALADRLHRQGFTVITAVPGESFEQVGTNSYKFAPHRPEDYTRILRAIPSPGPRSYCVFHLLGVSDHYGLLFDSLFLLAQALGETSSAQSVDADSRIRMFVVTRDIQNVNGEEHIEPARSVLVGPSLVISQEYAGITCRAIDISISGRSDRLHRERLVSQLLHELDLNDEPVVAYRGSHRWVPSYQQIQVSASERTACLRQRGAYLVTGGLGGIGLKLGVDLARRVQARVALLGRTGLPPQARWDSWLESHAEQDRTCRCIRDLRDIEASGGEYMLAQADVTDREALERALATIRSRFGALNGVIHAAGLPPKGVIQYKSLAQAHAVMASKVTGTQLLQELAGELLDFFVLCSSQRSILGGAGAVDYAAANGFMDAFARSYSKSGGPRVISILWDGWREVGMTARRSDLPDSSIDELPGMSVSEGTEVFHRILCSGLSEVIVSTHELQRIIARHRNKTARHLIESPQERTAALQPRPESATTYAAPSNEVERVLADIWADALGLERVGVHDNFFDLGGDSVVSIQIVARAKKVGLQLTTRQMFQTQTLAGLAQLCGKTPEPTADLGMVVGNVPLTPIQRWFFENAFTDSHHWNQSCSLTLEDEPDPAALAETWRQLVAHHDMLRTRFAVRNGTWSAEIGSRTDDASVSVVDLSGQSSTQQRAMMESRAAQAQASFDFTQGPLVRALFFRIGKDRPGILLFIVHHLLIDIPSWRTLTDDFLSVYEQLRRNSTPHLPAKTTSFKQWSERLAEYARSDALRDEASYWLGLPWHEVEPLRPDWQGACDLVEAEQAYVHRLKQTFLKRVSEELVGLERLVLQNIVLAALAISIARRTHGAAVLIDVEGHGRAELFADADLSRTVGWFTSIYPVVLRVGAELEGRATLTALNGQISGVPSNGLGYGLLRYLSEDRDLAASVRSLPRAQICFLFLGRADRPNRDREPQMPSGWMGLQRSPRSARPYSLEVQARVIEGELHIRWSYGRNQFRPDTIEALARDFERQLEAFVCHAALSAVPSGVM